MSRPLGFLQEQHEIPESIHIVLYLEFLELYQRQRASMPALGINVFHDPWVVAGKYTLLKFKVSMSQMDQQHATQRQVEPSSCGKIHILYRKKKKKYVFSLKRKLFNYFMICLNLKIINTYIFCFHQIKIAYYVFVGFPLLC